MIIDFHSHIFPQKIAASTISLLEDRIGYKAVIEATEQGILSSMNKANIDCSVILPVVTAPRQFESINKFARELNEKYGKEGTSGIPRLLSFGGIHPDNENYKEHLKQLKNLGFKGIKLHPDYQGVDFDDIRYERIINYASELDMVVVVHAGIDMGLPDPVRCTPEKAAKVLKSTQAKKLVLAHFGGWGLWDKVENMLVGSEAYFDISLIYKYIKKEQFLRIVKAHGVDKILFGTDVPWGDQSETVKWLQESVLSEKEKDAIFSQNAVSLLNLQKI